MWALCYLLVICSWFVRDFLVIRFCVNVEKRLYYAVSGVCSPCLVPALNLMNFAEQFSKCHVISRFSDKIACWISEKTAICLFLFSHKSLTVHAIPSITAVHIRKITNFFISPYPFTGDYNAEKIKDGKWKIKNL